MIRVRDKNEEAVSLKVTVADYFLSLLSLLSTDEMKADISKAGVTGDSIQNSKKKPL